MKTNGKKPTFCPRPAVGLLALGACATPGRRTHNDHGDDDPLCDTDTTPQQQQQNQAVHPTRPRRQGRRRPPKRDRGKKRNNKPRKKKRKGPLFPLSVYPGFSFIKYPDLSRFFHAYIPIPCVIFLERL
ncbi:hypothetical protein pdul_cds_1061 [Pandoravirus dulcis]|uniref:Uncharacterized protein n=1 Tax=Pandoravirus dulcis TaxID=1349409 RepID=A0A291AU85_9VIRU|nr:hypothetical protein pdul_cds_1061 [Pandoravirus dulcis]ATE82582.1 hypothetical protein pdul_cds_1061 [Pandoravirus dulcis]